MAVSGHLITTYVLLSNREVKKFAFLTKPKVKMAGYWPSYFFSVFMGRDDVEVHKNGKKERGLYPAILTEHTWSKNDLLYRKDISLYQESRRSCLFREPGEKAVFVAQ